MLTGISKKIELAANLAIILIACLLATVLIKNYLLAKPSDQSAISGNDISQSTKDGPIKVGRNSRSRTFSFRPDGL